MTKGKDRAKQRKKLRAQLKRSTVTGRVNTTKLIRAKYGQGATSKEIG